MEVATAKEARALTNKTKAITPGTLKEVLSSYATKEYADTHGGGGGGGTGLVNDVRVNGTSVVTNKIANVSVPTSLSQLTNDAHYVQSVNNYIPDSMISNDIKQQVVEVETQAALPNPGKSGKIYVIKSNNKIYRYVSDQSSYVELSETLQLGETSSTAYRGDRGKTAYDHSQLVGPTTNPHGLTLGTFNITVSKDEINYLSGLSENIIDALNKKLNLTGGVMTGYLTLKESMPALEWHAAPKKYVDNAIYSVAVSVHQRVQHFNNIVDTMNTHAESIGYNSEALIQVNNKVQGYSFVRYIEKDFEEHTGVFEINVNYFIRNNDTYTAVPYDSTTHTYTIDNVEYAEGDVIPSNIHLYVIIGDYDVGDSIIPTYTPDITYKEDINYYEKNENIFVPLVAGTDYDINSEIPEDVYCDNTYEEETTIQYKPTEHTRYKSGASYWIENYTPVVTQDTHFLDNKIYFKYNGTEYITLIPIVDYMVNDSISVVSGTVYEKGYNGTYTSLVEGTDYSVGDYIVDKVYQQMAITNYILTEDTEFESGKTYYYRVLSSGIDTLLQTHKESITGIISEEGKISTRVSTVESFIDKNIKGDNGLIKTVTEAGGKLGKLETTVKNVVSGQSGIDKSIQRILGENSTMKVSLTTLERTTKNFSTDSYSKTEVQKIIDGTGHFITRDDVYTEGRRYFVMDDTTNTWRELEPNEYTIGNPIPDNMVYEYGKTKVVSSESGKFDEDGLLIATEEIYGYTYKKTSDIYFQPATHYYTINNGTATQVYSMHIIPSEDTLYDSSKEYYILNNAKYILFPPDEYILTTDLTYEENKNYYIYSATQADYIQITPYVYTLTQDSTYQNNKEYYIIGEDNKYILTTDYTVGEEIPLNSIYEYVSGSYYIDDDIDDEDYIYEYVVHYAYGDSIDPAMDLFELTGDFNLGDPCSTFEYTSDTTVQSNKQYYEKDNSTNLYTPVQLQPGASITPNTYYERDTIYYVEDEEKTRFTSETIGRYNEKGMKIRKVSDPYNENNNVEILYAGVDENDSNKSIVRTINLNVREFLYAASDSNNNPHMRIEAFKSSNSTPTGWGMFYL